ncbi:MAG: tetratricopeptide repeat protein [Phycisphaerales bacterium]|nr:MAG: tetratricopeptide repeat protein [Phycisphaerales bacterium]
MPPHGWRAAMIPVGIALAAVVMGLPSLRGGFLHGDDFHLARDHVLVNHPSIRHAIKLFDPDANRDLYQPVPLLTFAANFAAVHAVGLTADAEGPGAGAWLFHLTNVLIHAGNAVLVWWLLSRLSRNRFVPIVAAILFAVHPLNAETVAWLSGRMMLTSTLFALATLIAFDRWLADRRWLAALLCVVFTALTMMCKVRVGLPVLMLIVIVLRGARSHRRAWALWAAAAAITASFALLNVRMSEGMLKGGAEELRGSAVVRTALALAWYVQHYVVPTGLAPWHPTPNPAQWSDPRLPAAAVVVLAAVGAVSVSLRRTRIGAVGGVWFLATIAATLPLLPSRNLLVAERYMYLPAIGFHWIAAVAAVAAAAALQRRLSRPVAVSLAAVAGAAWGLGLLVTSWQCCAAYRTTIDRALRVASCYPEEEGVWNRLAGAYADANRYEDAWRAAHEELDRHPDTMACTAGHQAGMALYRLGRIDDGIAAIQRAIAADPTDAKAHARLGTIYSELGRYEQAVTHYERAVELAPNYNPALTALGSLHRKLGQFEPARRAFNSALENNPYEVPALYGLADIDMEQGLYREAAQRLQSLLTWMPENAGAWINLGVCNVNLHRRDDAIAAYRRAVEVAPHSIAAVLNLATLLAERSDAAEAETLLQAQLHADPTRRPVQIAYHDLLVSQKRLASAARLWVEAIEREGDLPDLVAWYGWTSAMARRDPQAEESATRVLASDPDHALARASLTLVELQRARPIQAVEHAERITNLSDPNPPDVTSRLLKALETVSTTHPDDPFPIYIASMLLIDQGRLDPARQGIEAFKTLCHDPAWHERADALIAKSTPENAQQ